MVLSLKRWKSRSSPGIEARATCIMHEYQNPFTHVSYPFANANVAGWSSPVARQAHNLKVTGSNPVPATKPTYPHTRPPRYTPQGDFCVCRSKPSAGSRPCRRPLSARVSAVEKVERSDRGGAELCCVKLDNSMRRPASPATSIPRGVLSTRCLKKIAPSTARHAQTCSDRQALWRQCAVGAGERRAMRHPRHRGPGGRARLRRSRRLCCHRHLPALIHQSPL